MITSLSFANPRPAKPVRPFGFTVRNADNDNRASNAAIVAQAHCPDCERTHCSCSGEGPLGAA